MIATPDQRTFHAEYSEDARTLEIIDTRQGKPLWKIEAAHGKFTGIAIAEHAGMGTGVLISADERTVHRDGTYSSGYSRWVFYIDQLSACVITIDSGTWNEVSYFMGFGFGPLHLDLEQ
jgi:hypothetical protein